ncbi:MAG: hypothetical protein ACE14M_01155 [Terriglobales bacterium]
MGPADDDKLASVRNPHSSDVDLVAAKNRGDDELEPFRPVHVVGMLIVLLLGSACWFLVRIPEPTGPADAISVGRLLEPIQLRKDVQTLAADSWRALPVHTSRPAMLKVMLEVKSGNPVDVFLTDDSGIAALKERKFSGVRSEPQFRAESVKNYRRAGFIRQGAYYVVIRDPSLGVFSARSSDIAVNIRLEP